MFANEMKPGVNPVWKIVSNNMHVFVIDFVLVQIWGLFLFLQEHLQNHHSMSGTCILKRHTVSS